MNISDIHNRVREWIDYYLPFSKVLRFFLWALIVGAAIFWIGVSIEFWFGSKFHVVTFVGLEIACISTAIGTAIVTVSFNSRVVNNFSVAAAKAFLNVFFMGTLFWASALAGLEMLMINVVGINLIDYSSVVGVLMSATTFALILAPFYNWKVRTNSRED